MKPESKLEYKKRLRGYRALSERWAEKLTCSFRQFDNSLFRIDSRFDSAEVIRAELQKQSVELSLAQAEEIRAELLVIEKTRN